jgi:hypothetical protein
MSFWGRLSNKKMARDLFHFSGGEDRRSIHHCVSHNTGDEAPMKRLSSTASYSCKVFKQTHSPDIDNTVAVLQLILSLLQYNRTSNTAQYRSPRSCVHSVLLQNHGFSCPSGVGSNKNGTRSLSFFRQRSSLHSSLRFTQHRGEDEAPRKRLSSTASYSCKFSNRPILRHR